MHKEIKQDNSIDIIIKYANNLTTHNKAEVGMKLKVTLLKYTKVFSTKLIIIQQFFIKN